MRPARLSIVSALCVASLFLAARAANDPARGFPLTPGTYWIYRGLVRSWQEGSSVGKVTDVTWKMSVARVVARDGITAVVISGWPGDLDWSEGHADPKISLLVVTPDAMFYLKTDSAAQDRIDDPRYPLKELVDADDVILQLPLAEGKKFCDPEAMKREDGEYCWVTGSPHPAALDGVKGLAPGKHVAYEMKFDTNPDDTEFEFVEGVGIISYAYHHHGTLADTELHLVELHSPTP